MSKIHSKALLNHYREKKLCVELLFFSKISSFGKKGDDCRTTNMVKFSSLIWRLASSFTLVTGQASMHALLTKHPTSFSLVMWWPSQQMPGMGWLT